MEILAISILTLEERHYKANLLNQKKESRSCELKREKKTDLAERTHGKTKIKGKGTRSSVHGEAHVKCVTKKAAAGGMRDEEGHQATHLHTEDVGQDAPPSRAPCAQAREHAMEISGVGGDAGSIGSRATCSDRGARSPSTTLPES